MVRPRVVVYGEASVDGKITVAPGVLLLFGDERWPGGSDPEARERLLSLHSPQAMLEGSGSFLPDDAQGEPLPPGRCARDSSLDFLPADIALRPGFRGWFVVVDGRGRVRWYYTGEPGREAPGSEGWHLLVLVAHATPSAYLAYLEREHVPYLVAGNQRVDLKQALERLETLGVETLLVTSPGRLGNALLRAGLVDEIDIDVLPAVIGGSGTATLFGGPDLQVGERPQPLDLLSVERGTSGRVLLRYRVLR